MIEAQLLLLLIYRRLYFSLFRASLLHDVRHSHSSLLKKFGNVESGEFWGPRFGVEGWNLQFTKSPFPMHFLFTCSDTFAVDALSSHNAVSLLRIIWWLGVHSANCNSWVSWVKLLQNRATGMCISWKLEKLWYNRITAISKKFNKL